MAPVEKPKRSIANRPRSPSPPYFSFSDSYTLPVASTSSTSSAIDADQEALRAFYLEKVVNAYGKELDAFKQEPGIENRLERLVKSLAAGADLMTTSKLAVDTSIWGAKGTTAGDKELIMQSRQQSSTVEDVEMAS